MRAGYSRPEAADQVAQRAIIRVLTTCPVAGGRCDEPVDWGVQAFQDPTAGVTITVAGSSCTGDVVTVTKT
jgi:hypothetical protein